VGFDYTPLGADAKKDPAEPSLEVNTLRFDFSSMRAPGFTP
jgi:hypothetical protein